MVATPFFGWLCDSAFSPWVVSASGSVLIFVCFGLIGNLSLFLLFLQKFFLVRIGCFSSYSSYTFECQSYINSGLLSAGLDIFNFISRSCHLLSILRGIFWQCQWFSGSPRCSTNSSLLLCLLVFRFWILGSPRRQFWLGPDCSY